VEAELESEEPTKMGGDASTSEDEGDRGIVMTIVERREPVATSVGGGRDAERHDDVPESRKLVASEDAVVEQEAKQARLPHTSEVSLALHPPPLL